MPIRPLPSNTPLSVIIAIIACATPPRHRLTDQRSRRPVIPATLVAAIHCRPPAGHWAAAARHHAIAIVHASHSDAIRHYCRFRDTTRIRATPTPAFSFILSYQAFSVAFMPVIHHYCWRRRPPSIYARIPHCRRAFVQRYVSAACWPDIIACCHSFYHAITIHAMPRAPSRQLVDCRLMNTWLYTAVTLFFPPHCCLASGQDGFRDATGSRYYCIYCIESHHVI